MAVDLETINKNLTNVEIELLQRQNDILSQDGSKVGDEVGDEEGDEGYEGEYEDEEGEGEGEEEE